jgi:HK97 family phage portal protein
VSAIARIAERRALLVVSGDEISEGENTEKLRTMFGGARTAAGVDVSPESALRHIAVNAAVRLKVNAARSIPLQVYGEQTEGFKDYTAGRQSRNWALVHEQPNPEQSADEVWSQLVGHLAYRANAFLYKERFDTGPRRGLVRWLWPLDPRRLVVKRKDGRRVYELHRAPDRVDAHPDKLSAQDIVHLRSGIMAADGLTALSPIAQCREELGVHLATRDYLAGHLGRGANFSGYLTVDDDNVEIDDDERARMEAGLIGPGRGARGVDHIPIFNADIKWHQVGMSLADQQFLDLMGFGVAEVALLMGFPPTLLNAPVRSGALTYRNASEEDLRFLKYGLSPDLVAIETGLRIDADLFAASGYIPEFRREAHLAMDTLARYGAHALAIRAGWKTPNEVRRAENMPPIEGGETVLRPGAKADDETRELLAELERFTGQAQPAAGDPAPALT